MKTFSEKIYEKLKEVPRGKLVTYKVLAEAVGSKAYRAVGTAMKKNEDPIGIPCYRVVKSNGEIGEYSSSSGIKEKIKKLTNDGIKIEGKKIVNLDRYLHMFK